MINMEELKRELSQSNVSYVKHPSLDLFLYKYTKSGMYANTWTETRKMCRGLVLDINFNYVSRPFDKFFNLAELQNNPSKGKIPSTKFETYEKIDGSLIVVSKYNNDLLVTSSGSFISMQAQYANILLQSKDANLIEDGYTYMFEIIYPENRIIVDYGDEVSITILGIRENKTGKYKTYNDIRKFSENFKCKYPKIYSFNSLDDLEKYMEVNNTSTREGLVICWDNDFHAKYKFEEYSKISTAIQSITIRNIAKLLRDNTYDDYIQLIPLELIDMVEKIKTEILDMYNTYYNNVKKNCDEIKSIEYIDRKDMYIKIKHIKHHHIVLAMFDGKNIEQSIWKQVVKDITNNNKKLMEELLTFEKKHKHI